MSDALSAALIACVLAGAAILTAIAAWIHAAAARMAVDRHSDRCMTFALDRETRAEDPPRGFPPHACDGGEAPE